MLKRLLFAGLMALGLGHAHAASAEPYYGWTRLVNAAWTEEKGPSGGQCIDVPNGSKLPGTILKMWPCHNGNNQRFRLKDNNFESSRIAVYEGADERCLGRGYVASDPGNAVGILILDTCDNAPKWRTSARGEIATEDFKSCMTIPAGGGHLALVANCNPLDPAARERFGSSWHMSTLGTPYGTDHAVVSLAEYSCLDVKDGSTAPGALLAHWSCHGAANQTIQLRGVLEQVYITVYADGQMLCLSNVGAIDAGHLPSTQAVPCNRRDRRQAWDVVTSDTRGPGGEWGYQLVNNETGRCLDAFLDASAAVGAWNCHGGINQKWELLSLHRN